MKRHTTVLDMQVAGADTAERNAHNGITRALQLGLRLVDKLELAGGYVGVGEHSNYSISQMSLTISYNSRVRLSNAALSKMSIGEIFCPHVVSK